MGDRYRDGKLHDLRQTVLKGEEMKRRRTAVFEEADLNLFRSVEFRSENVSFCAERMSQNDTSWVLDGLGAEVETDILYMMLCNEMLQCEAHGEMYRIQGIESVQI